MNYYQILGVKATATTEEIQAAYRAISETDDIERRIEAGMALSVLTDEAKRDEFDQALLRDLQRREIERTKPAQAINQPSGSHQLTYIHQHYHYRTEAAQSDTTSPLMSGLIWFTVAFTATVVSFLVALIGVI